MDARKGDERELTPRMQQLLATTDRLIAKAKELLPTDPLLSVEVALAAAQYLKAIRALQRMEDASRG